MAISFTFYLVNNFRFHNDPFMGNELVNCSILKSLVSFHFCVCGEFSKLVEHVLIKERNCQGLSPDLNVYAYVIRDGEVCSCLESNANDVIEMRSDMKNPHNVSLK